MEFHPQILQNYPFKNLSQLKLIPHKIDLQYKQPIQLTSNWARNLRNMERYKDHGSVTKFYFSMQLRQDFLYFEDVNKIPV